MCRHLIVPGVKDTLRDNSFLLGVGVHGVVRPHVRDTDGHPAAATQDTVREDKVGVLLRTE